MPEQWVSVGILRGYNDTRAILCVTMISYWVFALPVGYYAWQDAFVGDPLGPQGVLDGVYCRRYPLQPSFGHQGSRVGTSVALRI